VHLKDSLETADGRGIRIFSMLYGDDAVLEVGSVLVHSYQNIVAERIEGRMLTLVADGKEAVIAHVPREGNPAGIRTKNPVLCLVAEEYLRHDLVLQRAKGIVGYDNWDQWWHADADLRAVYLGRTLRVAAKETSLATSASDKADTGKPGRGLKS
jgi:hypothetical protein